MASPKRMLLDKFEAISNRIENLSKLQLDRREDGTYMTVETIPVESDVYKEVDKGIVFRLITSKEDIKYPEETPYEKYVNDLDFENDLNFFIFFDEDRIHISHWHEYEEQLKVLHGKITDTLSGEVAKVGQTMTIPAQRIHSMKGDLEGVAISILKGAR